MSAITESRSVAQMPDTVKSRSERVLWRRRGSLVIYHGRQTQPQSTDCARITSRSAAEKLGGDAEAKDGLTAGSTGRRHVGETETASSSSFPVPECGELAGKPLFPQSASSPSGPLSEKSQQDRLPISGSGGNDDVGCGEGSSLSCG